MIKSIPAKSKETTSEAESFFGPALELLKQVVAPSGNSFKVEEMKINAANDRHRLDTLSALVTNPNTEPETREWATQQLQALLGFKKPTAEGGAPAAAYKFM